MPGEIPGDDDPITDDTMLYRWIPRHWIVEDNSIGRQRPSTQCFQNTTGTDEMSVCLGDTLEAQGRDPSELLEDLRSVGALSAGFVRDECEWTIELTPLEEELAHGSIVGHEDRKVMKKLAQKIECIEGDWSDAKI